MEALHQQRLHVLDEEPRARVEPLAAPVWGGLALLVSGRLPGGAPGVLAGLLPRTQTGVSEADVVFVLLSATWFGTWNY